jgi:hypothetical protein
MRRECGIGHEQQRQQDGTGHGEKFENRHGNHLTAKPASPSCTGRIDRPSSLSS